MFNQTFSELNSYHSIRVMLATVIFLFLSERNAWEKRSVNGMPHKSVNGMPHNLPLFPVFFYKCRASQLYRQNIAPIAFFRSQNSSKLPWEVLLSAHRAARETTLLMNRHVSIRIVSALQSPSNHLSPLVSFRSLPLPTILAL